MVKKKKQCYFVDSNIQPCENTVFREVFTFNQCNFRKVFLFKSSEDDFYGISSLRYLIIMRLEGSTVKSVFFFNVFRGN